MADTDWILRRGKHNVTAEYLCFLPWLGEFGWYVTNHVKRFHACQHPNKIACIRRGHECLFPTAKHFFYDWEDGVPDEIRAGVVDNPKESVIEGRIREKFGVDVAFATPNDTGWDEKTSLAEYHFKPQPLVNHDFKVDVVIAPRNRKLDLQRNWPIANWQYVVDRINKAGYTVAACGKVDQSHEPKGLKYKAWDYIDIDTDAELMNNSKLVIAQESGLLYLAMLCEKPIIVIDNYMANFSDPHKRSLLRAIPACWGDPSIVVTEALETLAKVS